MAASSVVVRIRVQTRPYRWFLTLFTPIAHVLGEERAMRIAQTAAQWLIWVKVDGHRWQRLGPR